MTARELVLMTLGAQPDPLKAERLLAAALNDIRTYTVADGDVHTYAPQSIPA